MKTKKSLCKLIQILEVMRTRSHTLGQEFHKFQKASFYDGQTRTDKKVGVSANQEDTNATDVKESDSEETSSQSTNSTEEVSRKKESTKKEENDTVGSKDTSTNSEESSATQTTELPAERDTPEAQQGGQGPSDKVEREPSPAEQEDDKIRESGTVREDGGSPGPKGDGP